MTSRCCAGPYLIFLLATTVSSPAWSTSLAGVLGTTSNGSAGSTQTLVMLTVSAPAGSSVVVAMAMDSLYGSVQCADSNSNIYGVDIDVGATGVADHSRLLVFSSHNTTGFAPGDHVVLTHPPT